MKISTHLAKVVSLPKLERRILNCTKKLRGKLIVFPSQGVQIKMTNTNKILTKVSAVGPNFPMKMTWERLILLSLSQKQPKNIFPDTGGAAYGWSGLCTVVQAAFYLSIFLGHTVCQYMDKFRELLRLFKKKRIQHFTPKTGVQCRILNCTGKLRRKLISNLVMSWSQRAEKTSHLGTSLKSHKKRIEVKYSVFKSSRLKVELKIQISWK